MRPRAAAIGRAILAGCPAASGTASGSSLEPNRGEQPSRPDTGQTKGATAAAAIASEPSADKNRPRGDCGEGQHGSQQSSAGPAIRAEAADLATAGYPDAACGSPEFILTSVRALATPSRVMLAMHVAPRHGPCSDSLSAEERSSGSRSSNSWSEIRRLVACCVIKIRKYIPQARPAANPAIPIHPVWDFRSSHIPPKPGPTMTSEAAKSVRSSAPLRRVADLDWGRWPWACRVILSFYPRPSRCSRSGRAEWPLQASPRHSRRRSMANPDREALKQELTPCYRMTYTALPLAELRTPS